MSDIKYYTDINADMGEHEGIMLPESDITLLSIISSVSISCGAHAGSTEVIKETIKLAVSNNIAIGAHPGYPDRVHFGRKELIMTDMELYDTLLQQLDQLRQMVEAEGGIVTHIKPHGALYNSASVNKSIASVIIKVIADNFPECSVFGQRGSWIETLARMRGITFISEVFSDREYNVDGTLVDRKIAGSVIEDPEKCARRAVSMVKENKIETMRGETVEVKANTICIHSDTPGAVQTARFIRRKLEEAGIIIKSTAKR